MRIAYLLTSLGMGGAERQAVAIAERMAQRGHNVALVVLLGRRAEEWPVPLEPGRVLYLGMRKNPASLIAGLAKARRFLREFQPDLIHSHTYPANIAARLLHLVHPAPVVSTIHSLRDGGWLRLLFYRLTAPLARRTTFVSQAGRARYLRLRAVFARNSSVVTNGIDTAEFVPNAERRARVRDEMNAEDAFLWLAAGRIVPAKDYPNLLAAFARVKAEIPGAQLWIAGEAMHKSEAPRENTPGVKSLAAAPESGVRWLGLRREMPALLDAADGFVLASAWEGMPLALGEAMAMEKPVVATDVGGVRELAGDCGIIVPAKDPQALAQAMLNLMRSPPADRLDRGRAARRRIQSHFSIAARAAEWEALYRNVFEERE